MIDVFSRHPNAIGVSSLAIGADQIFAETALAYGRGLIAVIPSAGAYADEFTGRDRAKYEATLAKARRVVNVSARDRTEAFLKAGERVARSVDLMVLVWDGEAAKGQGGTAEIVDFVRSRKTPAIWLHPIDRSARPLQG